MRKRVRMETAENGGGSGWNLMRIGLFSRVVIQKEHPMANEKNLEELFSEMLKDIYYAEKQILRALPKMAKEATSPELKKAFETDLHETEGQIDRLNQVFEQLG